MQMMHRIPNARDWRDMPLWIVLLMDADSSEAPKDWRQMFGTVFIYGYGTNQCADVTLHTEHAGTVTYAVFR